MSIEVQDLSFSYGSRQILGNVGLVIERGRCLSILGPNGSGKTTLLNNIAGLLSPSIGEILYDGVSYSKIKTHELSKLVGFVPQVIIPAFDYSVLDYVVTGCAPHLSAFGRPKQEHYDIAEAAINQMGIGHIINKSYRQISGGERQQVSIARVLAQHPVYILMDEPTSHLDYGNQVHVLKTIKRLAESGFGVVFTTHNPDQALLIGGKTAIIDRHGTLLFGDSLELINEGFLTKLYGTKLCITNLSNLGRKVCYAPSLADGEN